MEDGLSPQLPRIMFFRFGRSRRILLMERRTKRRLKAMSMMEIWKTKGLMDALRRY